MSSNQNKFLINYLRYHRNGHRTPHIRHENKHACQRNCLTSHNNNLSRLQEGHILLIQKFTVKKSYHPIENTKREPTIPDHLQMYNIDININSHHPVGEIRVISPTAVPACLELPTIQYNFVQRKDIG